MYYRDANGIEHESYEAACHYYGADSPADCEAEERYWAEIEADEDMNRRINDALLPPCWLDYIEPECPF